MPYDLMISCERMPHDFDQLVQVVADNLQIGEPHSSNLPCFGVPGLDFIRTLEWTVESLPEEPMAMCQRFREGVPGLRGFMTRVADVSVDQLPLFAWQDYQWVEAWKCPFLNENANRHH